MMDTVIFHQDVFDRISREKQERIIAAASGEFALRGLSAANINLIADEAGISVGSLYKYFESKTHLYLEVVNRGLTLIEHAVDPILRSDGSVGEKIDGILEAIFIGVEEYPVMNQLYSRYTAEVDEQLADQLSSRLESITATAYTELIRRAASEGIMPEDDDPRFSAFMMDNLFLTLQFSLSSEYWRNRMKIYLGPDILDRREELKSRTGIMLKRMLGLKR